MFAYCITEVHVKSNENLDFIYLEVFCQKYINFVFQISISQHLNLKNNS